MLFRSCSHSTSTTGPPSDEVECEQPSSSTQLTEATTLSAHLSDGSSEIDITPHSASNRSRSGSKRISMTGELDAVHTTSLTQTSRSPTTPLMHPPTGYGPSNANADGYTGIVSPSSSGHKARTVLVNGFKRSKQRIQSLFRPTSSENLAGSSSPDQ